MNFGQRIRNACVKNIDSSRGVTYRIALSKHFVEDALDVALDKDSMEQHAMKHPSETLLDQGCSLSFHIKNF